MSQASRISEASRARANLAVLMESYNGPTSYSTGGNFVTSLVFNALDRAQILGPSTSGHIVQVVTGSITGNSFKVQFFNPGTVSSGGSGEVPAATNLGLVGFYTLEEGISSTF